LTYGGEVAIVLSALEAFFSSWRFCNRKLTVFFNAAAVAISTTLVYVALKAFGLYSVEHLHGDTGYIQTLGIALSTIALVQFLANTTFCLSSRFDERRVYRFGKPGRTNTRGVLLLTSSARQVPGVLHLLTDSIGSGVILAVFPVIFFVFMTYRMYLKNIEISIQQADQANNTQRSWNSSPTPS
jgi:hypothetical protein